MRAIRAFVLGAGAAYFLDPRQGHRRRSLVRDRMLSTVHRARRRLGRRRRVLGGRLRGLAASVRPSSTRRDLRTDPATVAQRIRSEAFREAGVSTRAVEVEVDDGVVSLRGSVPSDEAADTLVTRVAGTPGVRDVAAMLRVERSQAA